MSRFMLNRVVKQLVNQPTARQTALQMTVRNSGHSVNYRTSNVHHARVTVIGAQAIGAFMWWWITWHICKQYDHIIGEFPYPDTTKWSNKELGVPADDA